MIIYAVTIGMSILSLFFSEHIKGKSGKYFFLSISVLIPAVLAGLRRMSVGTDTLTYYYAYFEPALSKNNFRELLPYIQSEGLEYVFVMWCYIIAKVFKSFHVFLFLTELATLIFIYKAVLTVKHKIGVYFPILVYYLLYYNNSFNIMRQSLACAVAMYAMVEIVLKGEKKFLALLLFAATIHYTALISLFACLLFCLIDKTKSAWKYEFAILLIFISIYLNIKRLVPILFNLGNIPIRYVTFFDGRLGDEIINVSFIVFKAVPLTFILLLAIGTTKKADLLKDKSLQIGYLLMAIIGISFFYYSGNTIERLLLYFEMYSTIIMVPMCIKKMATQKCNYIIYSFTGLIMISFWCWFYFIMRYGGVVPYVTF